mgnify:CR=1 FL=1
MASAVAAPPAGPGASISDSSFNDKVRFPSFVRTSFPRHSLMYTGQADRSPIVQHERG